jgi:hypothetical protein
MVILTHFRKGSPREPKKELWNPDGNANRNTVLNEEEERKRGSKRSRDFRPGNDAGAL